MAGEFYKRSFELYNLGRYPESATEARRGIQGENDPRCHAVLALVLSLDPKTRRDAESSLNTALSLAPDSDWIHYVACLIFLRKGETNAGEAHIRTAIRLHPKSGSHRYQLAKILRTREDWEGAMRELDIALELEPSNVLVLSERVELLAQLGRNAEAKLIGEELLRLAPDTGDSHAKAGIVALADKDPEAAFKAYREALRLNPNSWEAQDGVLSALRSKNALYRWVYSVDFWNRYRQFGAFANALLLFCICAIAYGNSVVVLPAPMILGIWLVLVVLWVTFEIAVALKPITNFVAMLHPVGRSLLNSHQRAESANLALTCILSSLSLVGLAVTHLSAFGGIVIVGLYSQLMMSSLAVAKQTGQRRWTIFALILTAQLVAVGALLLKRG